MKAAWLLMVLALVAGAARAQAPAGALEATTAGGEKVYLLPDGRWEFADVKKAEPQRVQREIQDARERSAQGILGGRRIYEGDRDYNRGSLNPKLR